METRTPTRIPIGLPRSATPPRTRLIPGAHAVISRAGAEVLISFFHNDNFDFSVTSEVMAGVERSFTSFEAAAGDATQSRLFAGAHFPFDLSTGQRLGN